MLWILIRLLHMVKLETCQYYMSNLTAIHITSE